MAITIRHKRGVAAKVAQHVGSSGEIVIVTDQNKLRLMDGSTVGGNPLVAEKAECDGDGRNIVSSYILYSALASSSQYKRPSLFTTNKTTVIIPKGLSVAISDDLYITDSSVTLQLSSVGTGSSLAGKDVYIYACKPSSDRVPVFVLSLNSTVPDGYTADNSRKIGGFHCLCKDVGTIEGHYLSGYVTGDIIPYSRQDLLHRPVCEPEGMVYIEDAGFWCQIYLPSWDGTKLVSRYGGVIVDGESSPGMGGEEFVYNSGLAGCKLIERDQFVVVARGSNEQTNINGSADPNTTGGHVDTNGQRMISNWGVEDCCGVLWQWSKDQYENYPGSTQNTSNYYLSGYNWQQKSVYNSSYESTAHGSCYGLLRRILLGAAWVDESLCGSRALRCRDLSAHGLRSYSARLVSESRVVNL